VSESDGSVGRPRDTSALRHSLDACVFAPVGAAVSVVEELPSLLAEGRRRVELQLGNALFVGRFVVNQKQRQLSARLEDLLSHGAPKEATGPAGAASDATTTPPEPAQPAPAPAAAAPDPAAAAIVDSALADYDTLSASQVVRRLESLGAEELRAVQRYEASTRNRRTILNRAGQLLDERSSGTPGS
jgi:hypothetical protein